jgi:thiol-disulfide isomerase/thioredoxin
MRIFLSLLILTYFTSASAEDLKPAPVYTLEQYQNRVLQQNDTLYVVNFWATWCKPCVQELPWFEALRQKLSAQPVQFVLVSQDLKSAGAHVSKFIAKNNYGSEVFILSAGNPNVWIDQIELSWTGTIPATLLYRNGQKISFKEGEFADQADLENFINSK